MTTYNPDAGNRENIPEGEGLGRDCEERKNCNATVQGEERELCSAVVYRKVRGYTEVDDTASDLGEMAGFRVVGEGIIIERDPPLGSRARPASPSLAPSITVPKESRPSLIFST